jgi:hypothetical protein
MIHATHRSPRERIWSTWTSRGDHHGEHNNKPLAERGAPGEPLDRRCGLAGIAS